MAMGSALQCDSETRTAMRLKPNNHADRVVVLYTVAGTFASAVNGRWPRLRCLERRLQNL